MSDRTGNARVKQSDSDERMRLAVDLQLKRAELALRRLEIAGKKRETSIVRSAAASPLMLARFGGIITVIGGIGANYYQAARALELKRSRATFSESGAVSVTRIAPLNLRVMRH